MKKVRQMRESKPERTEIDFDLILEDGHISKIKLKKEFNEWVLVGDDRQHFCQDELEEILDQITQLNQYEPSDY